jgi:hypothetical protein
MMLNTKTLLILIAILCALQACTRDAAIKQLQVPVKPKAVCPDMYNLRTEAYINPYMGTLERPGLLLQPSDFFPEKYVYFGVCKNPTNEFEICYLRNEIGVQNYNENELFVFDFCTGVARKIATNVRYGGNWSSLDWLIYTSKDGKLYKVKSNGDSLTALNISVASNDVKWSPDGTKFLYNGWHVMSSDGNKLTSLANKVYDYDWVDNDQIVYNTLYSMTVYVQSISTKTKKLLVDIPDGNSTFYSVIGNYLYCISSKNPGTYEALEITYKINLSTGDTSTVWSTPVSFMGYTCPSAGNKLFVSMVLRDTLTGGNTAVNNRRHHLAVMDMDGTNIRRIKIPE